MGGFGHVGWTFFVGVFCYQIKDLLARRVNLTPVVYVLLVVMVIIFTLPYELNHTQRMLWKLLLASLLVVGGSSITLSDPLKELSILGGDLAYPIYALHFPIFSWIQGLYQKLSGGKSAAIEAATLFAATLILSYLTLRLYDRPIRAYLTRLLKGSGSRSSPGSIAGVESGLMASEEDHRGCGAGRGVAEAPVTSSVIQRAPRP